MTKSQMLQKEMAREVLENMIQFLNDHSSDYVIVEDTVLKENRVYWGEKTIEAYIQEHYP